MKGAQVGCTETATNIVLYYMDECPANTMYISATDALLEKWTNRRLEPGIDSCGFRHKIMHNFALDLKTRRSADKGHSKEYIGGAIDMASAQSPPSLRAESKRILIRDEIDGAPPQTKTGEGSWLDVSYARTNAYANTKKIFDLSTPTTFDDSEIYKQFEYGDQRKYFVPCPHCGAYQVLEWDNIRPVYKHGSLLSVHYLCPHCKKEIHNHHKTEMLRQGEWKATAKSNSKMFRSYHISTLYSPAGMITWFEMYELFLKYQEKGDMRSFINLYLGLPYKEQGVRPRLDRLQSLRGTYKSGTVPDGVLYLTMAVDVQKGQEKEDGKPARLELEVCGHGKGFRTWSIIHKSIIGPIDDISGGAWQKLTEWYGEIEGAFYREDGLRFPISQILVDSGYNAHIVYEFCRTWQYTYPLKGYNFLKKKRIENRIDEAGTDYFRRYRLAKIGNQKNVILYEVSTNYYKHHIYTNLNRVRDEDKEVQSPGFCEFPRDYPDEYFKQLSAEERLSDGSFYHPRNRANEALDLRVYNMAASDIFLDKLVTDQKAEKKAQGLTDLQLQQINHNLILEQLTRRTKRRLDKR
jgi:phage terminase large subunit GpA-like protein